MNQGSTPDQATPKAIKFAFTATVVEVQQQKEECEAFTMCDK